ncbi:hypothetical protein D3C76_922010 [compost metagenome]
MMTKGATNTLDNVVARAAPSMSIAGKPSFPYMSTQSNSMFIAFLKRPAYMMIFVVPIPCSTEAAVVSTPSNSSENDKIFMKEVLYSNIGD